MTSKPTFKLISKSKHSADTFRRIALTLPGAVESSHMDHPDFRLKNRIFATLSAQANGCGMVKLTLEQQQAFPTELPNIFEPIPGGWGRMDATLVHLGGSEDILRGALTTAFTNLQLKQAATKQAHSTKSRSSNI